MHLFEMETDGDPSGGEGAVSLDNEAFQRVLLAPTLPLPLPLPAP